MLYILFIKSIYELNKKILDFENLYCLNEIKFFGQICTLKVMSVKSLKNRLFKI